MRFLNYFFFYTYIGLVVLAGFWGAFLLPWMDFPYLMEMDLSTLPEHAKINLLSQYRFLRALELGFGLFSLLFIKEIFNNVKFNKLFLTIMGMGILARLVSWLVDGTPNLLLLFFFAYEAVGWFIIMVYSRKLGIYHDIKR